MTAVSQCIITASRHTSCTLTQQRSGQQTLLIFRINTESLIFDAVGIQAILTRAPQCNKSSEYETSTAGDSIHIENRVRLREHFQIKSSQLTPNQGLLSTNSIKAFSIPARVKAKPRQTFISPSHTFDHTSPTRFSLQKMKKKSWTKCSISPTSKESSNFNRSVSHSHPRK